MHSFLSAEGLAHAWVVGEFFLCQCERLRLVIFNGHGAFSSFAETEAVVVLTLMVSHYKLSIKEEPQFAGETFEQRKERVLKWKSGITIRLSYSYHFALPYIDHGF